ncbi:hypothetical protein ABZ178_12150 [Streptomyces massasporeus]|uniref:hypothetical protein n=1 Tax=Streptomyces massasporeus TaxID=67324 RepID=UPI0033ABEDAD
MNEKSDHPFDFEPPIPRLLEGVDEEELTITVGLGLVARKAAEAEYILHGIYVHLVEAEKAYSELAVATGGKLVQQCRRKLEAAALAASCKTSLTEDLDAVEEGFRLRNRYLHGYWIYDDESYQWLTLKGAHGSERPEITFIDSTEVWGLAERFQRLCSSLLHWDTAHFGEPADDEDGHQGLVSRKRI